MADEAQPIAALVPRGAGHQFVCYADACSGVPGALHEGTFAAVNRVVARLKPNRAYFTHLSHSFDHGPAESALPAGVALAYDGLAVAF